MMMAHLIRLVSGDKCAMVMMIFVRIIHEISRGWLRACSLNGTRRE